MAENQILRNRYIKLENLNALLLQLFPSGDYEVDVSCFLYQLPKYAEPFLIRSPLGED
jgi:hypothetical protein